LKGAGFLGSSVGVVVGGAVVVTGFIVVNGFAVVDDVVDDDDEDEDEDGVVVVLVEVVVVLLLTLLTVLTLPLPVLPLLPPLLIESFARFGFFQVVALVCLLYQYDLPEVGSLVSTHISGGELLVVGVDDVDVDDDDVDDCELDDEPLEVLAAVGPPRHGGFCQLVFFVTLL